MAGQFRQQWNRRGVLLGLRRDHSDWMTAMGGGRIRSWSMPMFLSFDLYLNLNFVCVSIVGVFVNGKPNSDSAVLFHVPCRNSYFLTSRSNSVVFLRGFGDFSESCD